jgi:hypothetical protein
MPRSKEQQKNLEVFKLAFSSFQDFAVGARLNRLDQSDIAHGRNIVIWGWEAFSLTLKAYSLATDQGETYKNSGVEEVLKSLTTDYEPDEMLAANAHFLLKEFTFNDLNKPGKFLMGLESPELEEAMAFCVKIFDVGFERNDFNEMWPIIPLDEELWEVMTQPDKDFMKMFANFEASWGAVPLSAIDNFPKTRLLKSSKQYRFLLNRMQDIGVICQRPMDKEINYESSKDNLRFLGLR